MKVDVERCPFRPQRQEIWNNILLNVKRRGLREKSGPKEPFCA
jgi:hypothetical protein